MIIAPGNILNASLEKFFNGHIAAVSVDTDQLQTNKYEVAEMELFRHNVKGTVFSTHFNGNLTKQAQMMETGKIGFGLYFYTDYWTNPITSVNEIIPDYYATAWTSSGAGVFSNAVPGQSKLARYPNHGQEMYDISNGAYGYDFVNNVSGASNLSELKNWVDYQKNQHMLNNIRLSAFSYRNGRNDSSSVYIPYFLGARNSDSTTSGNATIMNPELIRSLDINKSSSTRTWDAWQNMGAFTTFADSLNYTKTQIERAISNGGWWQDFIHWHSVYDTNTLQYFGQMFAGVDAQINGRDVWRAGYGEVLEYFYLKEQIDIVGSFVREGKLYFYYRINDKFKETNTNGISNDVDETMLNTPVSISISTLNTPLAGMDIICEQASLIRKIDVNTWIISVPLIRKIDGEIVSFQIKQGSGSYYSNTKPAISRSVNTFTSTVPSKWVVWRKAAADGLNMIREVARDNVLKTSFTHTIEAGYNYYIGAISKFGHSSLIEI